MDDIEGLPIAYAVLESGVPVYSSDGVVVGTVDHVVAAPEKDIFHGIVMRMGEGHDRRFIPADQVESLHERGVDLKIDAQAADTLGHPEHGGQVYRDAEPGIKPSSWRHFLDLLTGATRQRPGWRRDE